MTVAVKPEVSVLYLLGAYQQLFRQQKNIYIVPVYINYDRIFELNQIS